MLGQSWRRAGSHATAGLMACVVAVATIVTGAGGAFAGGTGWKVAASPDTTVPGGRIESVSCPAADACTAVGTDLDPAGINVTLAERWNGTTWQRQATPNPREDTVASVAPALTGVSCPAANFCEAVGSYLLGGEAVSLAETWNGTRWTGQAFPTSPGSGQEGLSQVSCVSAQLCEAVGFSTQATGTAPLAARWNGTAWRLQRVTAPVNDTFVQLNAVSCASATFCEAWGGGYPNAPGSSFAEQWNGTAWHRQSVAANDDVRSVSCVSATFCEALNSQAAAAFAWNGTSWAKQKLPSLTGALSAVSCLSATFCEAVGAYFNDGVLQSAAAQWNGTRWSAQTPPNPAASTNTHLDGVSCVSASGCEAVGYFQLVQTSNQYKTVAEGWNGTAWLLQHPVDPAGATLNTLGSVSCVSASACEAVGSYTNGSGSAADLAEAWNGTSWSIQSVPNPTSPGNPASDSLDAVSCVSAQFCEAIGGGSPGDFAEQWNGTAWTTQTRPGEPSSQESVSCATVSFCLAVSGLGQVQEWNGTAWTAGTAPPGFSYLSGVSCVSASSCEVTGSGPSGESAAAGNGKTWTDQATPGPASATLTAVHCVTATSCAAVGAVYGQTTVTLAETWNGSAWTEQTTPNPAAAQSSVLNSVWCTSADACTAVGQYQFGDLGLTDTLAEVWNGKTWSLPSTPNGPNAGQNILGSVSCGAAAQCTAVGQTEDTGGVDSTLVETGS